MTYTIPCIHKIRVRLCMQGIFMSGIKEKLAWKLAGHKKLNKKALIFKQSCDQVEKWVGEQGKRKQRKK